MDDWATPQRLKLQICFRFFEGKRFEDVGFGGGGEWEGRESFGL